MSQTLYRNLLREATTVTQSEPFALGDHGSQTPSLFIKGVLGGAVINLQAFDPEATDVQEATNWVNTGDSFVTGVTIVPYSSLLFRISITGATATTSLTVTLVNTKPA